MKCTLALRSILFSLSTVLIAAAATPSEEADRLFKEAVALRERDEIGQACVKFEESQKLESSSGTLLNVGQCHETFGRYASAVSTYTLAKAQAEKRGRQDHAKKAEERLRAVEGKVAILTFDKTAVTDVLALRIDVDGTQTQASELAVDPGTHVIQLEASGYENAVVRALAPATGRSTVVFPSMKKVASAATMVKPKEEPKVLKNDGKGLSAAPGIIVGSIGLAGIGLGVVTGLVASSALSEAQGICPTYPNNCLPNADEPNSRAQTFSTVSTISFIAGGVLLAGGATLFVLSLGNGKVTAAPTTNGAVFTFKQTF
jgi:hypothetical protein